MKKANTENCNRNLTVRELINSVMGLVSGNQGISLDTEVSFMDINMQEFSNKLSLYILTNPYTHEKKLGIFIKEKEKDKFRLQEECLEETGLGEQEEVIEEKPCNSQWLNKYLK